MCNSLKNSKLCPFECTELSKVRGPYTSQLSAGFYPVFETFIRESFSVRGYVAIRNLEFRTSYAFEFFRGQVSLNRYPVSVKDFRTHG